MDWIPALLKHLAISRSVIGAIFITGLVLYVGPRVAPAYVDPVPKEWAPVLVGALVFSAALLLFWGTSAVWTFLARRWKTTSALVQSFQLNELEMHLLLAMGLNPSNPLNLERVNYESLELSRLEVLELVHGLSKKGLVSFNPFDSDLVSLTPTGRQRALELEREVKKNAA